MERAARGQHPARPCRDVRGRHGPAGAMRPPPVDRAPFVASSCLRGLPLRTPAIGGPAAAPRRLDGGTVLGRPRVPGHSRCGGGRRGTRGGRGRPCGPALRPVGVLVRAPPCDAWGQRLPWSSSWAGVEGVPTEGTPETSLPPRPSGPPRQRPRVRDALTPSPQGCGPPRAVVPSPGQVPQTTGRPRPPPHGPSGGRVRGDRRRPARLQRLACQEVVAHRRRHRAPAAGCWHPLRRSCPRSIRVVLTSYRRGAAVLPPPAVRAARPWTTRAMGVCHGARGGGRGSAPARAQGAPGARGPRGATVPRVRRWASRLCPFPEGHRRGNPVLLSSSRPSEAAAEAQDAPRSPRPAKSPGRG